MSIEIKSPDYLQKLLNQQETLKNYKIWIYRTNTIVVDIEHDNISYGMDILIPAGSANNNLTISIVPRNHLSANTLQKIFGKSDLFNNRIYLFKQNEDSSISNTNNLLNKIVSFIKETNSAISSYVLDNSSEINIYNVNKILSNVDFKKTEDSIELLLQDMVFKDMINFIDEYQYDMLQTIDLIIDKEMSLSRYGDGEIKLLNNLSFNHYFQKNSEQLNLHLQCILKNNFSENLMVTLPALSIEKEFWKNFWPKHWRPLSSFLKKKMYGNSLITRPEFFSMYGEKALNKWYQVWNNKICCFITGEKSRFNTEHILFKNIKQSTFIYSKSINAFDDLDRVLSEAKKLPNIDMYLIALGPSGTVLSSILCQQGFRALDIGHITNSYDTVFEGAPIPEKLPYK